MSPRDPQAAKVLKDSFGSKSGVISGRVLIGVFAHSGSVVVSDSFWKQLSEEARKRGLRPQLVYLQNLRSLEDFLSHCEQWADWLWVDLSSAPIQPADLKRIFQQLQKKGSVARWILNDVQRRAFRGAKGNWIRKESLSLKKEVQLLRRPSEEPDQGRSQVKRGAEKVKRASGLKVS